MATRAADNTGAPLVNRRGGDEGLQGTETKASFKTTELIVYVLAVVGVLIASLLVGGTGGTDPFGAQQAWSYITYLTIGYMVSRGLAKSGSRNPKAEGE